MTAEIYELIFRGLKAKYPGQAIGPHFQSVCAALDEWDESKHPRNEDGKFGNGGGTQREKRTTPVKEFLGKEYTGIKGHLCAH